MSQFTDEKTLRLLEKMVRHLGISTGTGALNGLARYANELIKWNKRVNLTGASSVRDFVTGPLFDALTLLPVLEGNGTLVDIGSGGGLPGVPAALLAPDLEVALVEPRSRRAVFLRHVTHLLGLRLEIREARHHQLEERTWGGAVAQAVWPAREWLKRAPRLVRKGGLVYVLSSGEIAEEDLPPGAIVEQAYETVRPSDGAKRHSIRVRV